MTGRYLSLLALCGLLIGCPGGKTSAPEPCRRFGQTCEFSPGKLGTCVERTSCEREPCFVCQSQH